MLKQAVEVLKEFQADSNADLQQKDLLIIEKKPGSQQIKKIQRCGFVFGTLSPEVSPEKLKLINERLKQKGIEADLEIAVPTGGPFANYGEIDNVFDNGKTILAHQPGQVLLVDVWATWCPPCQEPMAHNQEMLETNPHWNGKVRIVGVSVDDDKQVIRNRVHSKKWNKVQHLTLLGWKEDHPLLKDFKIQGIPFVCLVDKTGKINYVGHPNQIDLKKRIYELIAQSSEESAPIINSSTVDDKEVDQFLSNLSKQRVEEHFKDISLFCFKSIIKNSYQKGKLQRNGNIGAYIMEGQLNASERAAIFFGKHPGVQLKLEKVQYVKVPSIEGAQCWECCNKLEYPFYWLKWETQTKFGCRKCIEEKSHIEDHHYKYQKNSVLLVGKWDQLAAKNLGKNIQPSHPKDVERPHQFLCNICSQSCKNIGEPRYICQGCRLDPNFVGDYVDICENCVEKVIKGDEEVLQALKEEGHQANHPLLRILYCTHGYYDF